MKTFIKTLRNFGRKGRLFGRAFVKRLVSKPIVVASRAADDAPYALLSYIESPFRPKRNDFPSHGNYFEVRSIVKLLAELGFSVDVCDYNSKKYIDYSKYDLVVGFGPAFERAFYDGTDPVTVSLFTGACPEWYNKIEYLRIVDFQRRHGVRLRPRRVVTIPWYAACLLADEMALIGNEWTKSTYDHLRRDITTVPVPRTQGWVAGDLPTPINQRGKNFVWFGSFGSLIKGIDLLLDAWDSVPSDCHLHICGKLDAEPDLFAVFKHKIATDPRIHAHGFLRMDGQPLRELFDSCRFVIMPTAAEGMQGGVITCMAAGLVPVASQQTGIDIEKFGVVIRELSVASVLQAVDAALVIPDSQLQAMSAAAHQHTIEECTLENYAAGIEHCICTAFAKRNRPLPARAKTGG
jgi:hypothetical protein